MRKLNLVTVIMCVVFIALVAIALSIKDPLFIRYEAVLQGDMGKENIQDISLVLKRYPELQQVEQNLKQINHLEMNIRVLSECPYPNLDQEKESAMMNDRKRIEQLREKTEKLLDYIEKQHLVISL